MSVVDADAFGVLERGPNHPGDYRPEPRKSRPPSGMLGSERHRLVIETRDQPESTTTWH
jgi:hypothetical protein